MNLFPQGFVLNQDLFIKIVRNNVFYILHRHCLRLSDVVCFITNICQTIQITFGATLLQPCTPKALH